MGLTYDAGISISIRGTLALRGEDGRWKRNLTDEEKRIFVPGIPYEEFVTTQR